MNQNQTILIALWLTTRQKQSKDRIFWFWFLLVHKSNTALFRCNSSETDCFQSNSPSTARKHHHVTDEIAPRVRDVIAMPQIVHVFPVRPRGTFPFAEYLFGKQRSGLYHTVCATRCIRGRCVVAWTHNQSTRPPHMEIPLGYF